MEEDKNAPANSTSPVSIPSNKTADEIVAEFLKSSNISLVISPLIIKNIDDGSVIIEKPISISAKFN